MRGRRVKALRREAQEFRSDLFREAQIPLTAKASFKIVKRRYMDKQRPRGKGK